MIMLLRTWMWCRCCEANALANQQCVRVSCLAVVLLKLLRWRLQRWQRQQLRVQWCKSEEVAAGVWAVSLLLCGRDAVGPISSLLLC